MQTAQKLFDIIRSNSENPDFNFFNRVYEFARDAHKGQRRKSGEPYIIHPVAAAEILANLKLDNHLIAAALLHDVPEDTDKSVSDISSEFGEEIAFLVDGITKLSKVHYKHDMEARQVESLKKMFLHSAQDPRVILIKLADRLHNLKTLHHIPSTEKRLRIATETLEIFVPIADLMGVYILKNEIENICLKHVKPEIYSQIVNKKISAQTNLASKISKSINKIGHIFQNSQIDINITKQERTTYNIYKLIYLLSRPEREVYNTSIIKIIVPTEKDCYKALGLIHKLYPPKVGEIKDYIACPRINGFRSLQTTVFGEGGVLIDCHIETEKMNYRNNYGIAIEYVNPEIKKAIKFTSKEKNMLKNSYFLLKKIMSLQDDDLTHEEYIDNLKSDLFQRRIYVFTPKGEIIDLPMGSTGLDMAYAIHTDLGNNAIELELNHKKKPIISKLHTGDTVFIHTDEFSTGPKRAWVDIVKTTLAKKKIRDALKKTTNENKFRNGTNYLKKELQKTGLLLTDIPQRIWNEIFEKYHFDDYEQLAISVGIGDLRPVKIINYYYDYLSKKEDSFFAKTFNLKTHKKNYEFEADLVIKGKDQLKTVSEIISLITEKHLHIKSARYKDMGNYFISFISIQKINNTKLYKLISSIESINNVHEVNRNFNKQKIFLYSLTLFTSLAWLIHPIVAAKYHYLMNGKIQFFLINHIALFLLLLLIVYLKDVFVRRLPEQKEMKYFWPATTLLSFFSVAIILIEIIVFKLHYNFYLLGAGVIVLYWYSINNYLFYKKFHIANEEK